MSGLRQQKFLFVLFLLINDFILISSGYIFNSTSPDYHKGEGLNEEERKRKEEKEEEEKEKEEEEEEKGKEKEEEKENKEEKEKEKEEENQEEKNEKEKQIKEKKEEKEKRKEEEKEKNEEEEEKNEEEEEKKEKEKRKKVESTSIIDKGYAQDQDKEKSQEKNAEDGCEYVLPTQGIRADCIDSFPKDNNNNICCYMTINYEYNDYNLCIRIAKDINQIKTKITEIKKEYEGCNSVKIDCHSRFINYSFLILSIILFL